MCIINTQQFFKVCRIRVGCLLCIPLLLVIASQSLQAQLFSARIVDSVRGSLTVEQLYMEYEWGYFEKNQSGVDQYRTNRLRSYILLLQEKDIDKIISIPFEDIDSIQIMSNNIQENSTKGEIEIFANDGQTILCKLNYQPMDILSGYLNEDTTTAKGVFSLKRWIKGWVCTKGKKQRERYEVDLTGIRSLKVLHTFGAVSKPSQGHESEDYIRKLEKEKSVLEARIKEIQEELEQMRGE